MMGALWTAAESKFNTKLGLVKTQTARDVTGVRMTMSANALSGSCRVVAGDEATLCVVIESSGPNLEHARESAFHKADKLVEVFDHG